jgi:hypothetical protein
MLVTAKRRRWVRFATLVALQPVSMLGAPLAVAWMAEAPLAPAWVALGASVGALGCGWGGRRGHAAHVVGTLASIGCVLAIALCLDLAPKPPEVECAMPVTPFACIGLGIALGPLLAWGALLVAAARALGPARGVGASRVRALRAAIRRQRPTRGPYR